MVAVVTVSVVARPGWLDTSSSPLGGVGVSAWSITDPSKLVADAYDANPSAPGRESNCEPTRGVPSPRCVDSFTSVLVYA